MDVNSRMGAAGMTLADLSNAVIMIAALVVFFVMLLLILRNTAIIGVEAAQREDMLWGAGAPQKPSRLLMQRVHIPFTFKLTHTNSASYSEVRCMVSSTVSYTRVCWWGAPVRELHSVLWLPLGDVLSADILAGHTSPTTPLARCGPHSERGVSLSLEAPLSLGGPPRRRYPLVVMLARCEQDTADLRPDDTVALISVVHIQDPSCPLATGVLAQYLKQANGQLSCLKQLYVTGETEETAGDSGDAAYGSPAAGALCCVCAARPLSRALLPCRHACLCAACFPKLDKCPICRSGITSYFCIRAEDDNGTETTGKRATRWPFSIHHRLLDLFPYH